MYVAIYIYISLSLYIYIYICIYTLLYIHTHIHRPAAACGAGPVLGRAAPGGCLSAFGGNHSSNTSIFWQTSSELLLKFR